MQSFVHLLKAYLGPGLIGLPWAVSRLGLWIGGVAIIVIAFWSSYNCWTLVRIKRYIEHQREYEDAKKDEEKNESSNENQEQVTYPVLGGWAYGDLFQLFVR